MKDATDTTRDIGKAKKFEKSGGYQQALDDFNSMKPNYTKDITTKYGEGKYGTLGDGTKLSVRPGSKTGESTLEIKIPGRGIIKIRY